MSHEEDTMIELQHKTIEELQAENKELEEQIAVIYDESQAENVTLIGKNEQFQAENKRLKEIIEKALLEDSFQAIVATLADYDSCPALQDK
jgi:flagellar motility protein MotE (MotC chaperone)